MYRLFSCLRKKSPAGNLAVSVAEKTQLIPVSVNAQLDGSVSAKKCPGCLSRFFSRFRNASHAERAIWVGGVVGPVYGTLRLALSDNLIPSIPLVGSTISNIYLKMFAGFLAGHYQGASIGNRLGEVIDIWRSSGIPPARAILNKVLPITFTGLSLTLLFAASCAGGKPLFENYAQLEIFEEVLLAALYGAYIGGTLSARTGRWIDLTFGFEPKKVDGAVSATPNATSNVTPNSTVQRP